RINGVVIDDALIADEEQHHAGEPEPLAEAACALANHELLRQRAVALQLFSDSDALDDACVDALLERELAVPEPTRADC
ncbi:peptidylprolyl isomerase, partial [Pandoraea pneumonica]